MSVSINYLAVIVSAVAAMGIGFAWYSKSLFGKRWMKLVGLSEAELEKRKKEMGPKYGLMAVSALVMAYVLTHIVYYTGATTISGGMQAGFWVWLGFVATTSLGDVIFVGRPRDLYLINVGYHLVTLLAMGSILAVWA